MSPSKTPTGATAPRLTFANASRQLLRETVLAAVDELAAERPWSSVTMAQVAAAAGVSRQTLYNEFGTREELAQAYVMWATEQFLDEVERAIIANRADPTTAVAAAFEAFLNLAGEHPLVRALVATSHADGLHALVSSPAGLPILTGATDRIVRIALATWPAVQEDDLRLIGEVIVRLGISHLTIPSSTPAVAAEEVHRVLSPFIAALADSFR